MPVALNRAFTLVNLVRENVEAQVPVALEEIDLAVVPGHCGVDSVPALWKSIQGIDWPWSVIDLVARNVVAEILVAAENVGLLHTWVSVWTLRQSHVAPSVVPRADYRH